MAGVSNPSAGGLAGLSLMERCALELEIDFLLLSSNVGGDDAEEIESVARRFDRGIFPGGLAPDRAKMMAKLLRRRAMSLRTARVTRPSPT
jgi:hypothetical protein